MRHLEVLSKSIKNILFYHFRDYFAKDPAYSELKIVNRKSDLEVPAKGIFFKNVSYDKLQFASDNYIGNIKAFSSIAKVGNYDSAFLEFAQDDQCNLYAVVEEDLSDQIAPGKFTFNVSHEMVKQNRETRQPYPADSPEQMEAYINDTAVEVTSVSGREKTFSLASTPVLGDKLVVRYIKRNLAHPGYYFLQLDEEAKNLYLGTFHAIDDYKIYPKFKNVQINFAPNFLTTTPIKIYLDGVELTTGFEKVLSGNFINFFKRPDGLTLQIFNANTNTPIPSGPNTWFFKRYKEEVLVNSSIGNEVYLQPSEMAIRDIKVYFNNKSIPDYRYSNNRIVLTKPVKVGTQIKVSYTYSDKVVRNSVPVSTVFDDNTKFKLPHQNIYPDFFEAYKGFSKIPPESYTVDYTNGFITFKDVVDADYIVHYRIDKGTQGPFPVKKETWTNTLIPGVVLYFGSIFKPGDKTVVLVGDQQKNCADEYGGKWRFSVELGVKTLSPEDTEDLADKLVMLIWARLKPLLDAQGMFVEDVQHGGESEEEISESTSDTDFQASISLVVYSDWWYRVPRKFRFMSISTALQPMLDITEAVAESGLFLPNFKTKEVYYLDTIERY